jgi:hypothetical protein
MQAVNLWNSLQALGQSLFSAAVFAMKGFKVRFVALATLYHNTHTHTHTHTPFPAHPHMTKFDIVTAS